MATVATSLVVVVTAALLVVVQPAHAHGGPGVVELRSEGSVPEGPTELAVSITYENDGEPAEGAIVDATASGPEGVVTPPVRLGSTADPGIYRAGLELPAPGEWTVTVTSAFPPGSLAVPLTVRPATSDPALASTTGTSTTTASTTTSTTSGPTVPTLEEPEVGGAEGGTDRTNLVVAAVSGVLGGVLGLWASRRRSARRRARDGG
jgi:hypothetical protein